MVKSFKPLIEKNRLRAAKKIPDFKSICFLDIGAADNIGERWSSFRSLITYFGFEPDARSRKELDVQLKGFFKKGTIFSKGAWSNEKTIQINLTQKPQVSSFFKPNEKFLSNFRDVNRFKVTKVEEMEVLRVDSLDLPPLDFIKLDIQGGELEALKGARKALKNVMGIECEVEFYPLYDGQPLFGEVADYLSKKGFAFIDFVSLARWDRKLRSGLGQCVAADAFFIRLPEDIDWKKMTNEKIANYIFILFVYQRFDLIDKTFDMLAANGLYSSRAWLSFKKEVEALARVRKLANSLLHLISRIFRFLGFNFKAYLIY